MFAKLGGRKFFVILVAMILVALQSVLDIDESAIQYIVYLALGGSGAIAIEDSIKHIRKK